MLNQNGIQIKVGDEHGMYRRFMLNEISYASLVSTLKELFGSDEFETSYIDEEGDKVVFSTDGELEDLVQRNPTLLKINFRIASQKHFFTPSFPCDATSAPTDETVPTDENVIDPRTKIRMENVRKRMQEGSISQEKGQRMLEKMEWKCGNAGRKNGSEIYEKRQQIWDLREKIQEAKEKEDKETVKELKEKVQEIRAQIQTIRCSNRTEQRKATETPEDPNFAIMKEFKEKKNQQRDAFRKAKSSGASKEEIELLRKAKDDAWNQWKLKKQEMFGKGGGCRKTGGCGGKAGFHCRK